MAGSKQEEETQEEEKKHAVEMMRSEQNAHFDLSSYLYCQRVHMENQWHWFSAASFPYLCKVNVQKRDNSPKEMLIANAF